jgi:hypothetical protein
VPSGEGRRRLAEPLAIPYGGHQLGLLVTGLHSQELEKRGRPENAIHREAGVALELAEGDRGGVPEDAVHPAGVEPQRPQTLLQLCHVVSPHHRRAAVQEPVAKQEAGFDQRGPGLLPAAPVHPEAPTVLEGFHRRPGGTAETTFGVTGGVEAQCPEAPLDVHHRFSGVSLAEGERSLTRLEGGDTIGLALG